jgi:hypothetical protein
VSGHTAGPWKLWNHDYGDVVFVNDAGGVWRVPGDAIPEMLEALRKVDAYFRECAREFAETGKLDPNGAPFVDSVRLDVLADDAGEATRAAIAKAEGGSDD